MDSIFFFFSLLPLIPLHNSVISLIEPFPVKSMLHESSNLCDTLQKADIGRTYDPLPLPNENTISKVSY
ncbi:hypothetical protein Hanom_Chr03g00198631 [Helianthus anomalus]